MVLPVVFAGFERERHIGTVRKCLTQFVQRIHDLAHQDLRAMNEEEGSMSSESGILEDSAPLMKGGCLASYFRLVSRLIYSKAAKPVSQPKADSHQPQEEQEPAVLLWQNISFLRIGLQNWQTQLRKMIDHVDQLHDTDFGLPVAARVPSSQTRLNILQEELNSIGRKDARINQEISRVNLEVAKMARLDGSLMKSIAMLGMVFLPATFVSVS
ncbi:hypothetical protein H9L39_03905 [Fusarium oxysporum f. sp. albedinis]|nr:hypothetical protein H9L39_03905 [Fusarium oxysporum f. sp. albedinis]